MRADAILLVIISVCSAAGAERRDGVKVLPVIDKQRFRLVTLSTNGEEFKNRIRGIAQDNQGFMWFATDTGLYRYDGYTLTPYLPRDQYGRRNGDSVPATPSEGVDWRLSSEMPGVPPDRV